MVGLSQDSWLFGSV